MQQKNIGIGGRLASHRRGIGVKLPLAAALERIERSRSSVLASSSSYINNIEINRAAWPSMHANARNHRRNADVPEPAKGKYENFARGSNIPKRLSSAARNAIGAALG